MMSEVKRAVAIFSGGLDSTVLAYYLKASGYGLHLLSFNYGQRHVRELLSARRIARSLGVAHYVVSVPTLQELLDSVLTKVGCDVPQGHYTHERMRTTFVPNRNAIMLSIAYGVAISKGAQVVAYGAHNGDEAIYPDCRPQFVELLQKALQVGNESSVGLLVPFLRKTKADIVRLGHVLGVPFESTYSCYNGRSSHCGLCGTCIERREAFRLAGVEDPTTYEVPFEESARVGGIPC